MKKQKTYRVRALKTNNVIRITEGADYELTLETPNAYYIIDDIGNVSSIPKKYMVKIEVVKKCEYCGEHCDDTCEDVKTPMIMALVCVSLAIALTVSMVFIFN